MKRKIGDSVEAMDFENLKSDTEHLTMTRFIMSDIRDADLAILMSAIQLSCKVITRAVRKAGNLLDRKIILSFDQTLRMACGY